MPSAHTQITSSSPCTGSCHSAESCGGAVCTALTHPGRPTRSETNLPCLWLWQGSGWWAHHPGIWATLACLCWGAWSNGSKHQPHSPCVTQLSNHAWGESKSLAQCCSQCIIHYLKKKRQAEKPLHWLTEEILNVSILHRGKIQNKCATSWPIRHRHLECFSISLYLLRQSIGSSPCVCTIP